MPYAKNASIDAAIRHLGNIVSEASAASWLATCDTGLSHSGRSEVRTVMTDIINRATSAQMYLRMVDASESAKVSA